MKTRTKLSIKICFKSRVDTIFIKMITRVVRGTASFPTAIKKGWWTGREHEQMVARLLALERFRVDTGKRELVKAYHGEFLGTVEFLKSIPEIAGRPLDAALGEGTQEYQQAEVERDEDLSQVSESNPLSEPPKGRTAEEELRVATAWADLLAWKENKAKARVEWAVSVIRRQADKEKLHMALRNQGKAYLIPPEDR